MRMVAFIIALAVAVFGIDKISFFRKPGIRIWILQAIFVLKVAIGIGMLWMYENYYPKTTADVFNYFKDGEVVHSVLKRSPSDYISILTGINSDQENLYNYYHEMAYWIKRYDYNLYNDNKPIIRLHALFRLFSGGNIYIHLVGFNFLSLFGLVAMFLFFHRWIQGRNELLLFLILFFTPTILFWGSGMLKESFLIFVFGLFLWLFQMVLFEKPKFTHWVLFVIFAFLMSRIKIYVLFSILPSLLWLVYYRVKPRASLWSFVGIHVGSLLVVLLVGYAYPDYNLVSILAGKQNDFIDFTKELAAAGSMVSLPRLSDSVFDIFKLAPLGLMNSLCRPQVFEAHNIMAFFAALENLVLNFLLLASLFFCKRENLRLPLVWFSVSFVVILMIIIGITTPVLGALVRYKLPALPFLLVIILFLGRGWRNILHGEKISALLTNFNRKMDWLHSMCFHTQQVKN